MENKKEPLMSAEEWTDKNYHNFLFKRLLAEAISEYSEIAIRWHLNNVKEVVCEEAEIGFDGEWKITVYKQSITNAVEKYIEINLNK